MTTNDNLPIFSVDVPLKQWETSKKDVKNGIHKIPPTQYRLWEEDVYEPKNPGMGMGLTMSQDCHL